MSTRVLQSLQSLQSLESSRLQRLENFSKAIKKREGRTTAFNALQSQDRIRILAKLKIKHFDWTTIEKKGLKNRIRAELDSMVNELQHTISKTVKAQSRIPSPSEKAPKAKDQYLLEHIKESSIAIESIVPVTPTIREIEDQNLFIFFERMLTYLEPHDRPDFSAINIPAARANAIRLWMDNNSYKLEGITQFNGMGLNLEILPSEIGKLRNLRILMLGNNKLSALPKEIANLKYLNHLVLANNQIKNVPETIGQLQCLERLSLANNQIEDLPIEMMQLVNLTLIILRGNPIASFPLPDQIGRLRIVK